MSVDVCVIHETEIQQAAASYAKLYEDSRYQHYNGNAKTRLKHLLSALKAHESHDECSEMAVKDLLKYMVTEDKSAAKYFLKEIFGKSHKPNLPKLEIHGV